MYFPFVFCTPVTFRIKPFGAELVIPETMTSPFLYLGFELKVILSSSTNIGCLSLSSVIIFTLSLQHYFHLCLYYYVISYTPALTMSKPKLKPVIQQPKIFSCSVSSQLILPITFSYSLHPDTLFPRNFCYIYFLSIFSPVKLMFPTFCLFQVTNFSTCYRIIQHNIIAHRIMHLK